MTVKTISQVRAEMHAHSAGDARGHDAHGHEEEKTFVPLFVPMGRVPGSDMMNCRGKKVPVHTTDILTRGEVMEEMTDDSMRSGSIGTIYKAWFLAIVCFIITIAMMFVNVYVAGVFAYLTGFYYSERLLNSSWSIGWFKGKSLVYTA